jgi:hypothetical protein
MAGYSGTPLAKKLGLKAGLTVHTIDAPENYLELIAPTPALTFAARPGRTVDLVHGFFTSSSALSKALEAVRARCGSGVTMWVSWPKKSSGLPTEVGEDLIRALALPLGFVDVKVCAVDEVWSGLKLVVRTSLR